MREARVFLESFLDGFGVAGLGPRLRRPGAPTHLFAEEDPATANVAGLSHSFENESEAELSNLLATLEHADVESGTHLFPWEAALLRRLVETALDTEATQLE